LHGLQLGSRIVLRILNSSELLALSSGLLSAKPAAAVRLHDIGGGVSLSQLLCFSLDFFALGCRHLPASPATGQSLEFSSSLIFLEFVTPLQSFGHKKLAIASNAARHDGGLCSRTKGLFNS
jgi:hypothetical protein